MRPLFSSSRLAMLAIVAPVLAALVCAGAAQATILTFDVSGGVVNFLPVPADYGDNVASTLQGGHAYGVGAEGFTPDVIVDFGTPGEIPALWPTGYGDLGNVHFNDQDGDLTFTVRFTATVGFEVTLLDFDLASFSNGGQTIQGLSVRDVLGGTELFGLGQTFVTGASHLPVTPNVTARQLELVIDLTGLGTLSDNIGVDNIRFGQVVAPIDDPVSDIAEPATLGLLGGGLIGLGLARRRIRGLEQPKDHRVSR